MPRGVALPRISRANFFSYAVIFVECGHGIPAMLQTGQESPAVRAVIHCNTAHNIIFPLFS